MLRLIYPNSKPIWCLFLSIHWIGAIASKAQSERERGDLRSEVERRYQGYTPKSSISEWDFPSKEPSIDRGPTCFFYWFVPFKGQTVYFVSAILPSTTAIFTNLVEDISFVPVLARMGMLKMMWIEGQSYGLTVRNSHETDAQTISPCNGQTLL